MKRPGNYRYQWVKLFPVGCIGLMFVPLPVPRFNPYCEVAVDDQQPFGRTAVQRRTDNPQWGDDFEMYVHTHMLH